MVLEQKVPPLLLTVVLALFMYVFNRLDLGVIVKSQYSLGAALILLLIGTGLILAGAVSFQIHKTTVNPVSTENVTTLVRTGVYKFTRNPMYVGMLIILSGLSILSENLLNIIWPLFFFGYMNRFQIAPEERFLSGTFGGDYQDYMNRVRRWL